jgi:hypothetical protein
MHFNKFDSDGIALYLKTSNFIPRPLPSIGHPFLFVEEWFVCYKAIEETAMHNLARKWAFLVMVAALFGYRGVKLEAHLQDDSCYCGAETTGGGWVIIYYTSQYGEFQWGDWAELRSHYHIGRGGDAFTCSLFCKSDAKALSNAMCEFGDYPSVPEDPEYYVQIAQSWVWYDPNNDTGGTASGGFTVGGDGTGASKEVYCSDVDDL